LPSSDLVLRARHAPLIPKDSLAGSALVAVIAILTFLACLTAGGAVLMSDAAHGWRSEVLSEVTIQIKPKSGVDVQGLVDKAVSAVSGTPGVEKVHAYSALESEKLLAPWLGSGLDLSLLPVPRLVVVAMSDQSSDGLTRLRDILARAVPEASLNDHRAWAARIGAMANAIVGLAAMVFTLTLVAMATAIGFATRGAMAGVKEIIDVLHFVGASDSFIAREFQRHFRRLGLRGAMIGGLSAIVFFVAVSFLSNTWSRSPGGSEIDAMFGSFSLSWAGYVGLLLVGAAVTLLTGYVSRIIVLRYLDDLL
jgi:cell division transport system permease protein